MTILKKEPTTARSCCKKVLVSNVKHTAAKEPSRRVRFSIKPSPELVGDKFLQSTDSRRRYMRRGSRSPNMLAIHAVRSSAEVAQIEAYDSHQEKLERQQQQQQQQHQHSRLYPVRSPVQSSSECCTHDSLHQEDSKDQQSRRESLTHHIRRSMSFPGKRKLQVSSLPAEIVDTELARTLFQKTHLTVAQKRRLSLEILSRVQL